MAIQLEANYSKKLGLPGYSSHQFSVTIKSELSDISQVQQESARLYALLQSSVDRELQQTGFLPGQVHQRTPQQNNNTNPHERHGYASSHNANYNTNRAPYQRNGRTQHRFNGHNNGHPAPDQWNCSLKQKELILKIIEENQLDKRNVEQISQQLFSAGVKNLNKLQASGLIDELIQQQEAQAAAGGGQ